MLKRYFIVFAILLGLFVSAEAAHATVYRVDPAATGSNNGSSWGDAYTSLQNAISNAGNVAKQTDEVWVHAGTYLSTSGLDRTISFPMKIRVEIYGGFLGLNHPSLPNGETQRDQRDYVKNATILSGDIGTLSDNTDNSYHVVIANSVAASAKLDGFRITAGFADDAATNGTQGAGILIKGTNSSPTIANCTITANAAHRQTGHTGSGGGIASVSSGSLATFTNCVISNNEAALKGGGVFMQDSHMAFANCLFNGNYTAHANDDGGGAVYMTVVSFSGDFKTTFTNCGFDGNYTNAGSGGAIFVTHDRCKLDVSALSI